MKDIKGFEGFYAITKSGKVWGYKRKHFLKLVISGKRFKYYIVTLTSPNIKGKASSTYVVHRLVAETYILNSENLPQVNHRNGIKTDNRVSNLEWCTNAQNRRHAAKHGLVSRGEAHHKSILTEKDVREILRLRPTTTLKELGRKFGVHYSTIGKIFQGENWKHLMT